MTLPTTNSAPTLDRATYIGGSRVGAIAGLSPYASALDVWAEMTGLVPPVEQTEPMAAGNALEPGIVALYSHLRGPMALSQPGSLRHPTRSWHGATPDAVRDASIDVQVKLVGAHSWHRWSQDESDGPEGIPPEVLAQVQWEMYVLRACDVARADLAHVAAMFGTELRVYPVPRDEELIGGLVELVDVFVERNIVGGETPVVTSANAESARRIVAARYPSVRRGMIESTPEIELLAQAYLLARSTKDAAEAEQNLAAAELCARIGDAEGVEGSWGRATWRQRASGGTDWKSLAAELGATAEQIKAHARPGARALDVRKIKTT